MITIIKENILDSLRSKLANFEYQYVYVSIGSKYNVTYSKINDKNVKTNANYQMLPNFTKKKNQLIIMIDRFKEEQNLQDHIKFLNENIKDNTCILLNTYFDVNLIYDFLDVLLPKLFDHNINPTNFIIANYVKFLHIPNALERVSEKIIPSKIREYLNMFQDKVYKGCFYQWFGYNSYYLYSYIYNDEIFEHLHCSVSDLLELESIMKNVINTNKTETIVIQNQHLLYLLDEIIYLKEECLEGNNFTISIRQKLKQLNKLIEI